jgi:hypothetical protein
MDFITKLVGDLSGQTNRHWSLLILLSVSYLWFSRHLHCRQLCHGLSFELDAVLQSVDNTC